MMSREFNEMEFLRTVLELNETLGTMTSNKDYKNMVRSAIVHCNFSKEAVFLYFKSLFETHLPDYKDRCFDKEGWQKIYNHFINSEDYPGLGRELLGKEESFHTESEYELHFYSSARLFHLNPELIVLEISIDSLGWGSLVVTLVNIARESEIVSRMVKRENTTHRRKKTAVVNSKKDVCCKKDTDSTIIPSVTTGNKTVRPYRTHLVSYDKATGILMGVFESTMDAERKTGIKHSNIIPCLSGKSKSAGGFVWKKVNDVSVPDGPIPESIDISQIYSDMDSVISRDRSVSKRQAAPIILRDENGELVGRWKNRQEIISDLHISKSSLSKNLSSSANKNSYNRVWVTINGMKLHGKFEYDHTD